MTTPLFSIDPVHLPLIDNNGEALTHHWPVNRVFCIGRNYADHAREMGHDPDREPPFYFAKPASAVLANGRAFPLPTYSQQVEYEVEVVIGLNRGGRNLSLDEAKAAVAAVGIGLDMTCRDIQKAAKSAGRPWELAKGFDHSAPISGLQLIDFDELIRRYNTFSLTCNNKTVQAGRISDMVWAIPELIVEISQKMALSAGDLIMTGTPAGVGPVKAGDTLCATLDGFPQKLWVDIQ